MKLGIAFIVIAAVLLFGVQVSHVGFAEARTTLEPSKSA